MGDRQQATASRKESILDAALDLFVDRGLAGTSIDDIRQASGASVGSIYHHFGSKEQLAVRLYVDAIADYQQGALDAVHGTGSARTGIHRLVEQYLDWVAGNRPRATLMLAVDRSDILALARPDVARLNKAFQRSIADWLAGVRDARAVLDWPADLLLCVVLGPARRFTELWVSGRAGSAIAEARRLLPAAAWAAVSSHRAG